MINRQDSLAARVDSVFADLIRIATTAKEQAVGELYAGSEFDAKFSWRWNRKKIEAKIEEINELMGESK